MFGDQQVTVIILSYQNHTVLQRAVSSVLSQNYPNIQLIISDDHSNFFDQYTLEQWIEKNKQENLKDCIILRNEKNVGTVQNLIRAMGAMKGDYYLTLGADDALYDDSVISAYISFFQDHPDAWWITGFAYVMSPDMKKQLFRYPMNGDIPAFKRRDPKEMLSRWSCKGLAPAPAMCYKAGISDLVGGYDERYTLLEDWPLWLKLLRKGILPYLMEKNVVKHPTGGISRGNRGNNDISKRKIFLEDKYRLFENEVDAYPGQLISKRDRKAYRAYRKIFMDRAYTMEIEFEPLPRKEKLIMLLRRPKILFWKLQIKSVKIADTIMKATTRSEQWLLFSLLSIIAYTVLTPISSGIAPCFQVLALFIAAFTLVALLARLVISAWRRLKRLITGKRGYRDYRNF